MFVKSDIPQADNLKKVIETVEAVSEGAETDVHISQAIGYTERQARYYRHASEVLGFVYNKRNHAVITELGTKFITSSEEERLLLIRKSIISKPFFQSVLGFIESQVNGFLETNLVAYISSITDQDTQATIARRSKTILSWFQTLNIVQDEGDFYRYNDQLIDSFEEEDPETLKFPATYDQEVDIKEEWFSVFELRRKIGQRKVIMNPDFQRNLVWKKQQKSQFIESIILNIPLPPLYFRKELDGNYIVVDGLQRTSALDEFLSNKFPLTGLDALPNLNGCTFDQLEDRLQSRIEDRKLLVYNLQPQVPMKVVYDIFNRINTGGTKLARQEIRNCIFIGKSTTILKVLANSDEFKNAIDNGISPTRMKDREAVLRCLAFTIFDYDVDYKNSMDDFLEKAMRKLNGFKQTDIEILKDEFLGIMDATFRVFGEKNFRVPTEYSRGRINIAVLESVYSFFSKHPISFLVENSDRIRHNFELLLKDSNYQEAVRFSTGSKSSVQNRFYLANMTLSDI